MPKPSSHLNSITSFKSLKKISFLQKHLINNYNYNNKYYHTLSSLSFYKNLLTATSSLKNSINETLNKLNKQEEEESLVEPSFIKQKDHRLNNNKEEEEGLTSLTEQQQEGLNEEGLTTKEEEEEIDADKPLFSKKESIILHREKSALTTLLKIIETIEGSDEDISLLKKSTQQLEELFLMVIVGEFNAGKSSFINSLLGDHYLKEGITPTTSHLHVIRYGGNLAQKFDEKYQLINMELPLKWLKGMSVVDTPGTNAIIKEHQTITEMFVPRSDLIIFLTSAERPFSESEHSFLEMIRKWGKKVVVCINKYDLLLEEKDRKEVEVFVRDGIIRLLGFEPKIFCVSSRRAIEYKQKARISSFLTNDTNTTDTSSFGSSSSSLLRGEDDGIVNTTTTTIKKDNTKEQEDDELVKNWQELEQYILTTLNSIERVKLKLLSPLGVAENLSEKYLTNVIDVRLKILKEDKKTMDIIEEQLQIFYQEMKKDFELLQNRLDNIFHELIERGIGFYDNFLTLGNVSGLLKAQVVTEEFQNQVIADTAIQIENHVSETIDWIIDRKYRQWKAVTDFANKRARINSLNEEKLVGSLGSDFQFNRKELLLKIGTSTENVIQKYDREQNDTTKLYNEISNGLKTTAIAQLTALSIGVSSALLMPTVTMTGAGILGALMVGVGGLYALPYKRINLRKNFIKEVNKLRDTLKLKMKEDFEQELMAAIENIRNAITPYSRFVKVEFDKFTLQKERLLELQKIISQMRRDIENLQEEDLLDNGNNNKSGSGSGNKRKSGQQQYSGFSTSSLKK
ncbi:hypothetical protein ABK040_013061 [Willaertia magna]